jgi:hypothetical protein
MRWWPVSSECIGLKVSDHKHLLCFVLNSYNNSFWENLAKFSIFLNQNMSYINMNKN